MIFDTQWGHWFSRPGRQTLCLAEEGAQSLSFVLKRQLALFKEHCETPGNYVLNIEQFSEPTLLKISTAKVGTMSWRLTPPSPLIGVLSFFWQQRGLSSDMLSDLSRILAWAASAAFEEELDRQPNKSKSCNPDQNFGTFEWCLCRGMFQKFQGPQKLGQHLLGSVDNGGGFRDDPRSQFKLV